VSEIFNTTEQLKAAGGGVSIVPAYTPGRTQHRNGWRVYRVTATGLRIVTDKNAAWYDYGCKHFNESGTTRAEALEEAKRWVEATYGERGPWVRNRMGDYLPERIHKAFPLRPLPRKKP
jgi:hypothetical protein